MQTRVCNLWKHMCQDVISTSVGKHRRTNARSKTSFWNNTCQRVKGHSVVSSVGPDEHGDQGFTCTVQQSLKTSSSSNSSSTTCYWPANPKMRNKERHAAFMIKPRLNQNKSGSPRHTLTCTPFTVLVTQSLY